MMPATNNEEKLPKRKKFPWIHFLVTLLVEVAIVFIYFWIIGFFDKTALKDIYKGLADAFSAAGIIGLGVGGLVWIANQGAFNSLSFAVQKILSRFVPSMKVATMSYGDFLAEKKESEARFGYLLLAGTLFLIGGIVFIFLFYYGV